MAVFSFSKPANAGFLSFLENLFAKTDSVSQSITTNSQNIPLLAATASVGSESAKGGGDITIVNNNALLPEAGPMGTTADINDEKAGLDQISVYVVRKGDTLLEIAKMFGVSVNTIKWANDIKNSEQIHEGDLLVILPVSGIQYTVKKGDTIQSIAKKFDGDVNEINDFNDLNPKTSIAVGQTIIIPNGDIYEAPTSTGTKVQPNKLRGNSGPLYAGYYMRPITNGVKTQGLHGYNGVDLADSCGTPIYASASGDVILSRNSGWNAGYGQYIIVNHSNGTQTLYAHLSRNIAQVGWHVAKGQLIGYMGTTGRSTGCHVHFEIRGAKNPF